MPRPKAMAWLVIFAAPSTIAAATTTLFHGTEVTPVAHPINTEGQTPIPCLCLGFLGTGRKTGGLAAPDHRKGFGLGGRSHTRSAEKQSLAPAEVTKPGPPFSNASGRRPPRTERL